MNFPEKLPPLRKELILTRGGTDFNDNPTWIIHDPHDNRFYHIGYVEYQFYRFWPGESSQELLQTINEETTLTVTKEDLEQFLRFLAAAGLVKQPHKKVRSNAENMQNLAGETLFQKAARHYIFFRIPLISPDKFLTITAPYVRWIFTKTTFYMMLSLALFSLLLILRQWDTFVSTFSDIFSWQGLFFLTAALIISKIFHELGHAYQCKFQGLRVPTMGIAFMLLWPMLYTDTTESWCVTDNRKRLLISIAGLQMELYLAILASLLWSFLPDGTFRSAVFFIAAVSWVLSVLINLSPFLRFDGYHVLTDLLGARNLQTRSFKVTKWWLRKTIFGLDEQIPEPLTAKQRRIFIIYAVLTWLYRFFLFFGIALAIYYFFVNALGLLLFLTEVYVLIIKPVLKELKVWWRIHPQLSANRNLMISGSLIGLGLLVLFIPWYGTLRLPATLSYEYQTIFTSEAAQVQNIAVREGQVVKKGDLIIQLNSPELDFQILQAGEKIKEFSWKLRSLYATQEDLQNLQVVSEQLVQAQTQLQGLLIDKGKLTVTASLSGRVTNLAPSLHQGQWVKKGQLLLSIIDPNKTEISAFVQSKDLAHLKTGQKGKFVPEDIDHHSLYAKITDIDYQQSRTLVLGNQKASSGLLRENFDIALPAYHASVYGGKIPVRQDQKNNLVPEFSVYKITLIPEKNESMTHVLRGTLFLESKSKSIASRVWDRVAALFVRESGF